MVTKYPAACSANRREYFRPTLGAPCSRIRKKLMPSRRRQSQSAAEGRWKVATGQWLFIGRGQGPGDRLSLRWRVVLLPPGLLASRQVVGKLLGCRWTCWPADRLSAGRLAAGQGSWLVWWSRQVAGVEVLRLWLWLYSPVGRQFAVRLVGNVGRGRLVTGDPGRSLAW